MVNATQTLIYLVEQVRISNLVMIDELCVPLDNQHPYELYNKS